MKHKIITLATSLVMAVTPLAAVSTTQVKAAPSSTQTEMYNFVRNTLQKHHVRGIVTVVKNGVPQIGRASCRERV